MTTLLGAILILSTDPGVPTGTAPNVAVTMFESGFEAAQDANFDGWPDHWTRRRGKGYPTYLAIQLVDEEQAGSTGNRCLSIRLDGGAAQVFAPPLRVSPNFSYTLEASFRTVDLKHDVVSCSVALYDGDQSLLETYESPLIREAREWTRIRLGPFTPNSDRIRTAVLSVHVRGTSESDLTGCVFVDDVVFSRLPKMTVTTNVDSNLMTDPGEVRVLCQVSGFTETRPVISFELLDAYGKVLGTSQEVVSRAADSSDELPTVVKTAEVPEFGYTGTARWQPPIPDFGFYRVRVSTEGHSGRTLNLAVLPPMERVRSKEYGWSFSDGEGPLPIKVLPTLLGQVGVYWVKFPVWSDTRDAKRADELVWLTDRLSTHNMEVVGILDRLADQPRASLSSDLRTPAAALFEDATVWEAALAPVLNRFSLKIRWWQLGRDDDVSFGSHPDLVRKIAEIREQLTSFGQKMNVGIPWRCIEEPPDVKAPSWSFLSYHESPPLTDAETRAYLDGGTTPSVQKWVTLQPLSRRNYDVDVRARDLVLRMGSAKIAGATGIFVADPFHPDHGIMNPDGSPEDLLLPWRTGAAMIAGEYLGEIKLPHGSHNQTFLQDDQAVMLLWNDVQTTETLYLGENVRVYDIWGRQSTPAELVDGDSKQQVIQVGPTPIFVAGVDPHVARWRMHFEIQTARLASVFGQEQVVAYRFRNTFPQGIGGRITIVTPEDWKTTGGVRYFKVAPNEEHQDSFRVLLGPDANSGPQRLSVDFDLTSDRNRQFRLYETMHVGLDDIQVDVQTRFDDAGNLIVDQHLINNTDRYVNFNCYLFVPERRREKRQVIQLGQGRTLNTFVVPNGRSLLGQTLWVRAEEMGGARVLNRQIVVER